VRAAVITEDHGSEVLDAPDPSPGPDELVLRVQACGICGSDLKTAGAMPAGAVLGHEVCGEIVAIGREAGGKWKVGQPVSSMPLQACGRCRWCLSDDAAHCEKIELLGLGTSPGAFAEYVRVGAATTAALPAHLGDHGALVEPLAVGLHAVVSAGIRPDDRVLVIGGGSVGAAVTLWARRFGAGELVVSDPVASRRDSAAAFGATAAHDTNDGPVEPGFDVVLECVGGGGMIQSAIDAAATRGRVVIAGLCMSSDSIMPIAALLKEVEVRFAVYYRKSEFFLAASLLGTGELDVDGMVTARVGLDEVGDAFTRLRTTTSERKVLVMPAEASSSERFPTGRSGPER
jgi:2-desacetyl-2-hydroxyethyl bacteriochlorophyllide A dehydrogenase